MDVITPLFNFQQRKNDMEHKCRLQPNQPNQQHLTGYNVCRFCMWLLIKLFDDQALKVEI